jgi:hypothetical protein
MTSSSLLFNASKGFAEGIALKNKKNADALDTSITLLTDAKALLDITKLRAAKALEILPGYDKTSKNSPEDCVQLINRVNPDQIARDMGAAAGLVTATASGAASDVKRLATKGATTMLKYFQTAEEKAQEDIVRIGQLVDEYEQEDDPSEAEKKRLDIQTAIHHFINAYHNRHSLIEHHSKELTAFMIKTEHPKSVPMTLRNAYRRFTRRLPRILESPKTPIRKKSRKMTTMTAADALNSLSSFASAAFNGRGGTKKRRRTRR